MKMMPTLRPRPPLPVFPGTVNISLTRHLSPLFCDWPFPTWTMRCFFRPFYQAVTQSCWCGSQTVSEGNFSSYCPDLSSWGACPWGHIQHFLCGYHRAARVVISAVWQWDANHIPSGEMLRELAGRCHFSYVVGMSLLWVPSIFSRKEAGILGHGQLGADEPSGGYGMEEEALVLGSVDVAGVLAQLLTIHGS